MKDSLSFNDRLLFTHGAVQMAPRSIVAMNKADPVAFSFDNGDVPSLGYRVFFTAYAHAINLRESSTNEAQYLDSAINELRSIPRSSKALELKGSIGTYKKKNRFHEIMYRISNGQVLIINIQPTDKLQLARALRETPGLYKVRRSNDGSWTAGEKIAKATAGYGAVNGQSNSLGKATWLMGEHLDFEFGSVSEYTLFHNPSVGGKGDTWESIQDKFGFTTGVTKQFAKVLSDTQSADQKVKWVVHSQGGVIFSEGVRYVLNGNSRSALSNFSLNGLRHPDKGVVLNCHSVAFHGNANNNVRTKPLLKRAGIDVISTRANDYDAVNKLIGLNTLSPWQMLGSAVYFSHVVGGSVAQSPHTMMHKGYSDWDNKMEHSPGKGRNTLQKSFNRVDKYIRNYLK